MTKTLYSLLTYNQIPEIHSEQLEKFTLESIHAEAVQAIDPEALSQKLIDSEGSSIIGADLGGDKGVVKLFKVVNGVLVIHPEYEARVQGDKGEGYLDLLIDAAAYADAHSIPFGVSWGGPLNGTKPMYHPKASTFLEELAEKYDGDIAAISPSVKAVVNDGPAGALSGAIEAYRTFGATNSLFIINGGGIGTSVVSNGKLFAAEAGHVEGIDALNRYDQSVSCGVYDNKYVCLERLGANKAGIEAQWEALTGEYLRARDIEDRYKEGDLLAAELYDHSAHVIAHVVLGTAEAMNIDVTSANTVVVGHGGAFKFPAYGERIQQIVQQHLGAPIQLLMTKDFGPQDSNACLDGAVIAALCL